jgi:hypothetical protein
MNDAQRSRPRFTLRSLLIVVAILAVGLSWFVQWREAKRRERAAADAIINRGGSANYGKLEGWWADALALAMPRKSLHYSTCVEFPKNSTDADLALLRDLPNLETLQIENSPHISAAGLAHAGGLSRLNVLYLRHTPAGDRGLEPFKHNRHFKELWLEGSNVSDSVVSWIAANRGLTHLDLGGNPITDATLPQLATLEELQVLALDDTRVTSAGMASIANLPALTHLYLMQTAVDDVGLQHLQSLPRLQSIDLRFTGVTEEGLSEFRKAKPEIRFD